MFRNYSRNYIKDGNINILFNITSIEELSLRCSMSNPSWLKNQIFHLFITDKDLITNDLRNLVSEISISRKVIIHIPKQIEDIKLLIDETLDGLKCLILVEKKDVVFSYYNVNTKSKYDLIIKYEDYNIDVLFKFEDFKYENYFTHKNFRGITNKVMKERPEEFKDKIIKNFKNETPEEILNSFKNDEDIWDYIMNQGEWKVKEV